MAGEGGFVKEKRVLGRQTAGVCHPVAGQVSTRTLQVGLNEGVDLDKQKEGRTIRHAVQGG